jgi:hypothetical protein
VPGGLIPSALHTVGRYANNPIEADHGRLKARLRPMRGLKRHRSAPTLAAGHAFVQNLRRGHYDVATGTPSRHRLRIVLRDIDHLAETARGHGEHIGVYAAATGLAITEGTEEPFPCPSVPWRTARAGQEAMRPLTALTSSQARPDDLGAGLLYSYLIAQVRDD